MLPANALELAKPLAFTADTPIGVGESVVLKAACEYGCGSIPV
jgi:hypothetical protein